MVYPSVLSHLIRLKRHPENLATEALAHVLRNSPAARTALLRMLKQAGVALPDNLSFRTQYSGDDKSRPDLTGFDINNHEVLHIEAKFDAGLTDNQPVAYLKRLASDLSGMVLFIVPARRIEFLWFQVLEKIELTGSSPSGPISVVRYEPHPHFLGMSSWKYVLGALRSDLDEAGDFGAASDIRQLESACERIDAEAFRPLSAEELGPAVPRRVLQLLELLSDVGTRIHHHTGRAAKGNASGSWQEAYFYLPVSSVSIGGPSAGVALSFEAWAKYRETPIWFVINKAEQQRHIREKLTDLEQSSPPGVIFRSSNAWIPIRLSTKVDREEVLEEIVKQVLDISGRFAT